MAARPQLELEGRRVDRVECERNAARDGAARSVELDAVVARAMNMACELL